MFLFFVSPPTLVFVNHVAWLLQDSNAHALGPTFYETYHPQETWTTRSLEHICNLYDRYTVIVAAVNCYLSLASSRKPPFALQPCQGRRDGSRTWRAVGILWVETWQRFDFEDSRSFQVIFNINKIIHQPCLGWWEWISTEGNQEPKRSRFSQANHQILDSPGKNFGSGVPVNRADLAMGVCWIWFMMPIWWQVAWQVACWLRFWVFVIFFLVEEGCIVFVRISMETVRGYWDSWTSQVGFTCDWKVKLQQDLQSIQVWHLQT